MPHPSDRDGASAGSPPPITPAAADAPRFVLVAGESSGDLLGADLIAGLRRIHPKAQFAGVGGPRMAAAGMDVWYPAEQLAVMGLAEVLRHLPRLLSLRRELYKRTLSHSPDVFIGIDAPDFNLGLARRLKRSGIRTAHYVSPSVWAWREGRAAKLGRSADRVLCLFPMEPAIFLRHGVDARFVGHPLAREFPIEPDQHAARASLGIAIEVPVLALLPGSRLGEIERLGRDFLDTAMLLKLQFPDLQIVAPMATPACARAFRQLMDSRPALTNAGIHLLDGNARVAMIAADAVLLASGTAALEAMLAKRPMVVAYRLARLTYWLVKALGLMRTEVYSLPNILAGHTIVPELMQDDCKPSALAAALAPALRRRALEADTLAEFVRLHRSLLGDPAHDAAHAVVDLLNRR